jgi:hypothetical protein
VRGHEVDRPGVTLSAAMTRSPSFSRSGESTTTTIPPAAIAATASSTELNFCGKPAPLASVITKRLVERGYQQG